MENNLEPKRDLRTSKRRWIKLYPNESLNGSIRYQLTSAERGVWYDLMCFSSLCSNTGDISDRDCSPFPLAYIANRLNVQLPLLKSTIDKCLLEGRISEDEHGLHITNWGRYQSEYDRQKPYREKEKERIKAERIKYYQDESKKRELTDEEKFDFLCLSDDEIKVPEPPQAEEDIAREAEREAEQAGAYEPYDKHFRDAGQPVPD